MPKSLAPFIAVIMLHLAAAPARAQFTTVLNLPPDPAPASIAAGTQANLSAGGTLPANFTANAGSELNIAGGVVGAGLGIHGVANISGGEVGSGANASGTVNVTGGTIGTDFDVGGVANVNVSGGVIDGYSDVYTGARVTISGGAWGSPMVIRGGEVIVVGDDFKLDGAPVAGLDQLGDELTLELTGRSVLTGTLADGTPAAYSSWLSADVTPIVTLRRAQTPAATPTEIHLPGAAAPLGIRDGQTLTVAEEGELPPQFRVGAGGTLAVSGGVVGRRMHVFGGNVQLTNGRIEEGLLALGDATVDVSGGELQRFAFVAAGATINLTGGKLRNDARVFEGGVLNVSAGEVEEYLRAMGGVVNVSGGEIGEKFTAHDGAVVNVSGGLIRGDFKLGNGGIFGGSAPSVLNLTGGSIHGPFSTSFNSTVNMSGGFLGGLSGAGYGSVWNVSGGFIYDQFTVGNGSDVRITGGTIGNRFTVGGGGGPAVISGGAFGDSFQTRSFADVTFVGSDFRLDGAAIAGLDNAGDELPYDVPQGALLSGRFADGTPFAFTADESDSFNDGTLTLRRGADLPPQPALVHVSTISPLLGVGEGQTLLLTEGGRLGLHAGAGRGSIVRVAGGVLGENFEAVDAVIEISAGGVGRGFDAFNSTVTISGGVVGQWFEAKRGSRVDVTGGSIGDDFTARDGSVVNIRGGRVDRWFRAKSGSQVNISGGSIWASFQAEGGSAVNITGGATGIRFTAEADSHVAISGGHIGDFFSAEAGSNVTLLGTEFFLDGVPIAGLIVDVPFTITARDKLLTGRLADGSPFDLRLEKYPSNTDYIDPAAVLKIVPVHGHSDFDHDGDVDGDDLARWSENYGLTSAARAQGDANADAAIDGHDLLAWQRQLSPTSPTAAATPIPEPTTAALCLTLGAVAAILSAAKNLSAQRSF